MLALVLVHPEIPPNTGNLIRLTANIGAELHLVEPLGFTLNDRDLRRAGLDYHEFARVRTHANWDACQQALAGRRQLALSTRGETRYDQFHFATDDVLVFGSETRGLPPEVLDTFIPQNRLRLPMLPERRSQNLSNAAAVVVYEAWRQLDFVGGV